MTSVWQNRMLLKRLHLLSLAQAFKAFTYRLLTAEGLPVPRHAVFRFDDTGPAAAFLLASRRDCVVKPADGTGGGRGVTTGVRHPSHLARAAVLTQLLSEERCVGTLADNRGVSRP